MMRPHFLCVGARRSGTTWLYQNLRQHPQVWMPPVKSIRYFNNDGNPIPWIVAMWLGHEHRAMRRRVRQSLRHIIAGQDRKWLLRYFFLPRNDAWYLSLFQPEAGQTCGEICHAYGSLTNRQITKTVELLPDAMILYLLRNPVDRIWSETALYFRRRGRSIDSISEKGEITAMLDQIIASRGSDDLAKLSAWQTYYPASQFFVGYFDQLSEQPAEFLGSIHDFLRLTPGPDRVPVTVAQKVGSIPYPTLPDYFGDYLADKLADRLAALHQSLNTHYTAQWCERAVRSR